MPRGRPPLYDWDDLLSRPRVRLRRGVNYACSQAAIAQQARDALSERGLSGSVEDRHDSIVIVVANGKEVA